MKIIVVGDIHTYWAKLNVIINKYSPDIILQVGDFGYWPNFHNTTTISEGRPRRNQKPWNQYGIRSKNTKIYFCDGNHENHWELNKFKKPTIIYDNVCYMPRGSTLTLPDGRNVLFIGGAESIDKRERIIGVDWFPEEVITQKDIYNLPDINIDIIISHTCPNEFNEEVKKKFCLTDKFKDPSQDALSYLLKRYKPDEWYFGHFHDSLKGQYKNTTWFLMNEIDEPYSWRWLTKNSQ